MVWRTLCSKVSPGRSKWCEVGAKGSPGQGHSGGLRQEVGLERLLSKCWGARGVEGMEKGPSKELT